MTEVTGDEGPGRPLSVKEISERAQNFEWNVNIPFKHWLRTAQTLQQEADMYLNDRNFAQAYLLYLRYSTLVLELLQTHPDYKTSPEARKAHRKKLLTVDVVFNHLENIKPILERKYNAWQEAQTKKKSQLEHRRQGSAEALRRSSTYKKHASKDPALSSSNRLLDAGEHQDLAVELAQREIQRRDATRRATRQNGGAHREQQQRRAAGFWESWTEDLADKQAEDEQVFRNQMELTRMALDGDTGLPTSNHQRKEPRPAILPSVSSYSYPKIARSEPVEYTAAQYPRNPEAPLPQPPRPPKQEFVSYSALVPERPAKTPFPHEPTSHTYSDAQVSEELPSRPPKLPDSAPEPQPPKKEPSVAFKPAAYLENGEPIRPIFLPRQLRRRFLEIASDNTKRGLEMCGILCGTAVNNALFVRCLLIPEQKCTTDTCETENEASMLDYCMEEDLLMLGWIHTHPTQTCFMSSRDLHTQSGYQVMLPESIAIVCAPTSQPSYGIFRLTNPPGLSHILNCTQSSTFHPHSVDNLYTAAEHPPGHVYEHDSLDFYVKDIRPGARNGTIPN
ncbi:hypothetical protein NPX13_g6615 [Xylaria arbuscula]|uniref:MPN domain-containing protein n=1 Tax=Xylaria arbuscula TaxID=114810 RepID=A0A9W8TLK7_9PEZI|nr:hypothetical protein NPX13_g6615 [Xylaria arbuscula]